MDDKNNVNSVVDSTNTVPTATATASVPESTTSSKKKNSRHSDRPLFPFRYTAKTSSGRKITGIFEAESVNDCRHLLEVQGYTDIQVNLKKKYDIDIRSLLAGADSKKVKPQNWIRNIEDF